MCVREAIGKAIATYKTRLAERNKRRLRKPRPSLCHVHPAVRVSLRISLPPCLLQLRTMEISHHLLLARLPTCWWVSSLQTTHSCIIFFEKTFRSSPFWRSWCRTSRYFRLATPTQQLEKFGMRTRQPDGEREREKWLSHWIEILSGNIGHTVEKDRGYRMGCVSFSHCPCFRTLGANCFPTLLLLLLFIIITFLLFYHLLLTFSHTQALPRARPRSSVKKKHSFLEEQPDAMLSIVLPRISHALLSSNIFLVEILFIQMIFKLIK